jgi:hypothetical protein
MPTITSLDELLANLSPYLKSARPLEAMKEAGFTFKGEVGRAVDSVRPAIDPAAAERLEKEMASHLPIRLRIGETAKPSVPPVSRVVVGGFSAVGSIDLDNVNSVIDELFRVGTIPNALPASDTTKVIALSRLSQLCANVPTAPDATLGGLEILTAPLMSASSVSTGNLNMICEIKLPVLGSQPSFFQAKLNVEIPIGTLYIFTRLQDDRLRFSIAGDGAQATLLVNPLSEIVPRSPADLDTLNNLVTTGVQDVLGPYCGPFKGTLSLPAELTLSSFPNTPFKLTQAGGATVQSGQKSFVILGVNIANGQTVDPTQLTTVATPVAPFAIHGEIDEAFASDALTAVINSGDLAAYINRITSRHWWGDFLPKVNVNWGTVTFQDGNINLAIGISVPYYCLGFDLDINAGIYGPPVISNGTMTIGANSVDLSVDEGFWCSLTGIGPLLGLILDIIFIAKDASENDPVQTIPSSYSFAPLPGSDEDWTLAVQQASANNGALTVDGTATLAADPGYFIYLRIVTGNRVTGYTPLPNAQVTLMELDNPAPAGDDVAIPQTGTTIHTNSKFITIDSTSYTPASDQVLGTKTTDDNGDVMFLVEPATSSNPGGLNEEGGVLSTTQTEIDLQTGKTISDDNTTSIVPERFPDFGVAVTDSSGTVWATRQLVVLNATSTRIGTAQSPMLVVVSENVIIL